MRRFVIATVTVVVLAALAGGYAYADARDVVPGWITDDPVPVPPAPFPTAATAAPRAAAAPTPLVNADAPIPRASDIQALAEKLLADSRTSGSVGISVVDIETGEVLAAVQASDQQIPASNAKLMTAAGVYLGLGPDFTLETRVDWKGPRKGGATTISLVAGGDMMLAADYGHGDVVQGANGYAGLADLADETVIGLTAAGVDRVKLVMDDSAFVGPPVNPAWPSSAIDGGYVAPVTGMAVNVGKMSRGEYPPRWPDPSMNAAETFAKRLKERGIKVVSVEAGGVGKGAKTLAAVQSAPMLDVLTHMLHYSDNTIAEDLTMVLAIESGGPGTTDRGTARALKVARASGMKLDGVVLDDGSGFSRGSRLTAAAVTELLVFFATDPALDDVLRRLPVSGLSGTVAERLDGNSAGMVRAKTGSLSGVTSLSGTVLTADGRWLAFSVLADEMPYGQDAPRAAIDKFVRAIAACGCG